MREHIAVKEAQKLNIPIFAMVDTNSDPRPIDYVIPSNDDASKSIDVIMTQVTNSVAEGLAERKSESSTAAKDEPSAARKSRKDKEESTKVEEAPEVAKTEAKPEAAERPKEIEEVPVVKEAPTEASSPQAEEPSARAEEDKTKTEPKKSSKSTEGDDLTKIEGIGPKAAEALTNAGVDTYTKLANSKPEEIKELLAEASSRMAHLDPTSWPKQAKMAAEGKWDELKEWQDNAKAGIE
jgi:small subunit ribosomal protein S2